MRGGNIGSVNCLYWHNHLQSRLPVSRIHSHSIWQTRLMSQTKPAITNSATEGQANVKCVLILVFEILTWTLFVLTHSRLAHTGPVFPHAGVTRCRGSKANISIFLCWLIYKIQDINIIFCPQSQFMIAAGLWDTERVRAGQAGPAARGSNGHQISLYCLWNIKAFQLHSIKS